ncbi:MAG TPA: FG-GAP-like repeat-containing protein [Candidatus Sumerlaeota bacterium]|nr:FG-GAP-like repeat-containing protein [Candidatus Sumerlaeota bacterium]
MDDGSQGPEFSLDDNMTSDTTPVIAGPDLSIDKDDGGVTVIPGGTISYLLTYGNHGDQNTTGVVIMESVPADTVFNGAASSPGWVDQGGGVYRYEVGGLDVGTTGTLIFAVDVNDPVGPFTEIITNITSLSDDGQGGPDLNPDDNSSTDTTPVDAEVELAISKTDGGVSVQPDGTVVYTIAYANLGNQDSPEVRITDTIPALTSYAAGSSSPGWVEAGPVVTYDVGLLGGYTTGVLQIAFTVQNPVPAGAIQIENVVVIDDVYSGQQPVMPIDDAMAMDTTPLIAEPDLRIRKDDNSARVEAGGQLVSYEIFYINEGNQDATGVQVTETLPAFTTFNAGASTPGWMDQGGGVYTFDVGDLGVGPWEPPAPLVFAVNMLDPLPSDYTVTTNTVTIADDGANGADPNPANNTASDITPLKTMSSSTLIVFEDLKVAQQLYNDFEYNDFVMRSDVTETYDANNKLELIEMRVEALARGAIFNHIARLDLGLEGGVTATIQRFDANDVLVSQDIFVSADNPARSLQIFPLTKDALPPFPGGGGQLTNTEEQQSLAERTEGHYALITIRPRNAPANERIVDDPATTLDEHNSAIYGYNLYVVNSGSTIYHGWDHNTATLDIVSGSQWPASPLIGFPLPQAMLLPTAFEYPVEYTPIWESHLDFEPWIKSGMTTNQNWPLVNVVDEKTWPIDLAKALKRTAAAKAVDGLLFQQKLESAIPATPVLADMTQDGFVDIVYGHYLNLIVIENAFNHSEVVIDPFPEILVDSQCSPVVVDLNGDGLLDVIRGYDNGALVAYRHDGVELTPAGERLYLEGTIKGTPAVGDLDADGDPEIIVQTGHGLLYALGFDFSIRPGFPVDLGGTRDIGSHHFMTPSPALAPLPAGDGLAIIAVNLSGKVFSITWAGDVMPGWPVDLGGEVLASPAVGDLEGDGQIDIVIAMSDAPVYALTAEGQIKPGWPAQRRYGGTSSPSLADVNGDGQLEVFVGSYDENLYGFSADGKTLPGFPVATQSQIFASPFFADLDGDGTPEPLIGSSSGSLYAVCGESGPKADQPAVMAQATTLIATAGSVGDLDFDGRVEVVFGSHDGRIRVVETEAPVVPAGKTWNGFRGGLRNPGMISSILQVGNAAQAWELYQ